MKDPIPLTTGRVAAQLEHVLSTGPVRAYRRGADDAGVLALIEGKHPVGRISFKLSGRTWPQTATLWFSGMGLKTALPAVARREDVVALGRFHRRWRPFPEHWNVPLLWLCTAPWRRSALPTHRRQWQWLASRGLMEIKAEARQLNVWMADVPLDALAETAAGVRDLWLPLAVNRGGPQAAARKAAAEAPYEAEHLLWLEVATAPYSGLVHRVRSNAQARVSLVGHSAPEMEGEVELARREDGLHLTLCLGVPEREGFVRLRPEEGLWGALRSLLDDDLGDDRLDGEFLVELQGFHHQEAVVTERDTLISVGPHLEEMLLAGGWLRAQFVFADDEELVIGRIRTLLALWQRVCLHLAGG